jgi:hypothetical protein
MAHMVTVSHALADRLVTDLRAVFGERLRSVVAYGAQLDGDGDAPLSALVLVDTLTVDDLVGCAQHAQPWTRAGIATPLILPFDEFLRSLDVFPLEYGEIVRVHVELYGADPFAQVSIATEDLRRACEMQLKSHLLHLRESFIESGGTPRAVTELVHAAAPALAALLRNVARLAGTHAADRAEATRNGAHAAGLPAHVVTEILRLERPEAAPLGDSGGFFAEYLAAVERLVQVVDGWRAP